MALPLPLPLDHPTLPGLHLRRLRPSDAAAFHAAVTTYEIGRMLFMFPTDWPLSAAEAYLRDLIPRATAPFRLAIDAGDGVFLGSIGLVSQNPAELAFFLVPEAQRQGVMRAALDGLVDMVFAHLDTPALQARVYHDNPTSMAVLRRAGFVETGTTIGTCSAQRAGAERLHSFVLTRA
ncbi:MAG: N-acetyltransferase [Rhodobacteraceae bacterium]|nr:MAG: N-acetyltransferase [Paracoccaceae bacterium]